MALPRVRRADPITERRRLSDATPDAADGDAPEQRVGAFFEYQKRIRFITRDFVSLAPQAPTESGARQIIGGPGRLPRREKFAAPLAQRRPSQKVRTLRRPQINAVPSRQGRRIGEAIDTEERHRLF